MDSDIGKLFIGGISWETDENKLKDYFQAYGEVKEVVIMKDRATGRARGFGFVVFANPEVADRVLLDKHTIDGKMVEAKKALPRDEQQNLIRSSVSSGIPGPGGQIRTQKIFVGGLASTVTEQDLRKYFEQFGTITDVVVMYDHATQRPRGFGFISFDTEEAVENVMQKNFYELNEKMIEVKRAVPKELSAANRSPGSGGFPGTGAGRGAMYGGYGQGFPSTPAGGYMGHPDARFGPAPAGRGGYPTYGAGGYTAPGYGAAGAYGAMNGYAASGYGANAGYGAAPSGYGSSYAGAPSGAYGSGPGAGSYGAASGARSAWGANPPAYGGAGGYPSSAGASNYGAAVWGSGGTTGQNTASTPGYSSYAYGQTDGSYASNQGGYAARGAAGYGASGGAAGAGGYAGGFADGYGSTGYPDNTWRSGSSENYNANAAAAGAGPGTTPSGGGYVASGGSAGGDASASGLGGYGGGGYNVPGIQTQRGMAV